MLLFAHHMAVEIFGREFAPQTPLEHAAVFGVTGLVLALAGYGAYAGVRDLRRRRSGEQEPTPTAARL